MKRQDTKGWKIRLAVDVICVSIIASTALVACTTPINLDNTEEAVVTTVQTEAPETVPAETTTPEASVTLYNVPLSIELQLHIIQESEAHGIDPAVIIAMAWKESRYDATAKGDSGKSLGLLQIQPKWHKERMESLDCPDLLDPFQNVTVGVDILASLLSKYDGDISKALMAYNAGAAGANRYWFSKGIYSNDYSEDVLFVASELETYQAEI